jgi:2-methylcitrate dehydratase PrpD
MNDAAADAAVGLTRKLVEQARAIRWSSTPPDVRDVARQCLLDWIGVTIAAASDPLARLLLDDALAEGGTPAASLVGHAERVTASQAALINGATSHVLDYDDVNLSLNGHPSAAILPAVLALAESTNSQGAAALAAFVAGYEIAARVGLLVAPGHYARGYHATRTVGTVGCAVACAHLLGLDAERTSHAVGIAATQASGLKSMFGTQCKPFHAGLAAHDGLRAARLAAAGMLARTDALECAQGFALTLSPDFNPNAACATPAKFYLRENLFKYHASCYGTHAAIDCVRELRKTDSIEPRRVERVTVRVERGADRMCNIPSPTTALEAKFSLRFMTAAALAGVDTAGLEFFQDSNMRDPALCTLRDKVVIELMEDWPIMQAEVIVGLTDGRTVRATHDAGVPGTDYGEQGRRLKEKFTRLTAPAVGSARSDSILNYVDAIDDASIATLMRLCAVETGASHRAHAS